jgi:CarboxypepD_reg-like domain
VSLVKQLMEIKFSFLAGVLLFWLSYANAQTKGYLKGRVADTTSQHVLKQATVSILNANHSSLFTYGLTDDKGLFTFKNIPFGNYILQIAFTGIKRETLHSI